MLDLDRLDEDQRKAVTAPDGVIRVMAGAGTGKTTTLQSRIEYIMENKLAKPHEIMAVTFTNKAGGEIRERVEASVGEDAVKIRMGTFHSLSLRILRKYAEDTGLQSGSFTILDDDEVKILFDEAMSQSGIMPAFTPNPQPADMPNAVYKAQMKADEKEYNANRRTFLKETLKAVMRWKECGLHVSQATPEDAKTPSEVDMVRVYEAYQDLLSRKNMCDFSDLILRVVHLFDTMPSIAEKEAKRIKYLLVDEFQDTNMLQYRWLKHLSHYHGNLFVVGDLDQSLYSFRGSAPQIMERIEKDTTLDISLKVNRRCTQEILNPANKLVDVNTRSAPKVLNSEKTGDTVQFKTAPNEFGECNMIVSEIKSLLSSGTDPEEIAIIARAGYILKPFEKALLKASIPYCLTGNGSILDKEEVKDIMSFAKLAVDPYNDIAFQRIANKPARGLGPTTVTFIISTATAHGVSLFDACHMVASGAVKGGPRKSALEAISQLGGLLSSLAASCQLDVQPQLILDMAYTDSGYKTYIETTKKEDAKVRQKNIEFMRSYAAEFSSLVEFVQEFAIVTDAIDEGEGIRISSIHASKGLEFDHIFLPGWEENVFPSRMSVDEVPGDIDDPWVGPPIGGVEEERRIAHVALTRARKTAYVSRSVVRAGRKNKPSRFIREAGLGRVQVRDADYEIDPPSSSQSFGGIKFPNAQKVRARMSKSRPRVRVNRRKDNDAAT